MNVRDQKKSTRIILILAGSAFIFLLGLFAENRIHLLSMVYHGIRTKCVSPTENKPNPVTPAPENKEGAVPAETKPKEKFVAYSLRVRRVPEPAPILNNYPDFVSPITESQRFMGAPLIVDEHANLSVKSWRYSYNLRGIVEIYNRLDGRKTAVIVVHPWEIDNGSGFVTPEPAGVAFFCTPEKNAIYNRHVREVLSPFLDFVRPHVSLIGYSLFGEEDTIRKSLYQSPHTKMSELNVAQGKEKMRQVLTGFSYKGMSLPESVQITKGKETYTYFQNFPGLNASSRYNNSGFWDLPIPVHGSIRMKPEDVVFYDGDGYEGLKQYLIKRGIKHVLLAGYATDICVEHSAAGYMNLGKDFNVFIVGDATLATFPAHKDPNISTSAALAEASVSNLITEISWIEVLK